MNLTHDQSSIDITDLLRRGKLGTILNSHGGIMFLSRDALMSRNSVFMQKLEVGQTRQNLWAN